MFAGKRPGGLYRPEIDGLRSIAVLPVIFYHAALGPFGGGYVGVDIFFVISGYLITSIILGEIGKGRFTFAEFYERRVRRIFPALFVVTALSAAAAWFVLTPQAMRNFGESVAATMLFAANIFFFLKSGYFNADVELFPMIHMWSLAVEEQFYAIFPPVLLAIFCWRRRWLRPFLLAVLIVSFAASVAMQAHAPSANFFLPLSRAWELGLGALIASGDEQVRAFFERRPKLASSVDIAGLAMIAGAVMLLGRDTPFPGWFALPPVIGTALIVAASGPATLVGRLLSLRPFVFVGLLSYSAYLWHQPLLALARSYAGAPLHDEALAAIIALTFLLSFLSYRFVEKPFRNRAFLRRRTLFALAASLGAVIVAFGVAAYATQGFPQRFPADRLAIARTMQLSPMRDGCHTDGENYRPPRTACTYGGPNVDWAVLGDSHGIEIGYALAERLRAQGRGIMHLSFSACPPALGFDPRNPGCAAWTEEAVRQLEGSANIRNVLLAYRHSIYLYGDQRDMMARGRAARPLFLGGESAEAARAAYWRGFDTLVRRLRAAGKRVFVLGPVPELPAPAEWFAFRAPLGAAVPTSLFLERRRPILDRLSAMERAGLIRLIDVDPALCTPASCLPIVAGQSMYFDDNHLSMAGARRVLAREQSDGPLP
jgi:peptidoglycan/LPS O-acetylase OafA/YrhL